MDKENYNGQSSTQLKQTYEMDKRDGIGMGIDKN